MYALRACSVIAVSTRSTPRGWDRPSAGRFGSGFAAAVPFGTGFACAARRCGSTGVATQQQCTASRCTVSALRAETAWCFAPACGKHFLVPLRGTKPGASHLASPALSARGRRWLRHLPVASPFYAASRHKAGASHQPSPALFKRGDARCFAPGCGKHFYPASRGKPGASHLVQQGASHLARLLAPLAPKTRAATASGCFAPHRLFTLRVNACQSAKFWLTGKRLAALRAAYSRFFTS